MCGSEEEFLKKHPVGGIFNNGGMVKGLLVASAIWASNCSDITKTVVASFGTPYLYKYYENSGVTYVNAYADSKYVIEAFVKAVFGEIDFEGKSSVNH